MKREKILHSILIALCCIFIIPATISYAQDMDQENVGMVRGWIIDPETKEPVNERYIIEVWDANNLNSYSGYLGLINSNEKGYFEDQMVAGKFLFRFFLKNRSTKFCQKEPHPLLNDQYRFVVNIEKGKITDIRKEATIGGRIKVVIVDSGGTRIDLKEKFDVPRIDANVNVWNPNFYSELYLCSYSQDALQNGEIVGDAIFPGKYKLEVNFIGIGHGNGAIELKDILVEAGKIKTVYIPINLNDNTGLEGYIYDEDGAFIPDANVVFIPAVPGPTYHDNLEAFSDQSGFYRFIGIKEGKYSLLIAKPYGEDQIFSAEIKKGIVLRKDFRFGIHD
jgi:hypothetical protein